MKGVLPVFLEGLVNPSDEIRAICIVSIKKISRNAVRSSCSAVNAEDMLLLEVVLQEIFGDVFVFLIWSRVTC